MFAALFFLVLVNHALSEKYVYKTGNVIHIPCIENPAPSLCKLDYKVPDLSTFSSDQGLTLPTTASLNKTINGILNVWETLSMRNVSDECKSALTYYYCTAGFPVCDEQTHTITVHGHKVKDACTTAVEECAGLPQLSSFLPCSSMSQVTHPKGHVCDDLPKIPDDPYPCTGGMYNETYAILPVDKLNTTVAAVMRLHMRIKMENMSQSCKESAADVACKLAFQACTKDEKNTVSFINKEQCINGLQCVDANVLKDVGYPIDTACGVLPSGSNVITRLSLFDAFGFQNMSNETGGGDNGDNGDNGGQPMMVSQLATLLVVFIAIFI